MGYGVGNFLCALIGLGFKDSNVNNHPYFWRIYFSLPLIFSIIRSFTFLFYYKLDSPYYYI